MTLDDLGERICIMGPSGSGKSTLADAIGRARGLPAIHLDRLFHIPGTDWEPRPVEAFVQAHDEAIRGTHWVIDGNYTRCLPQRLAHATGLILLDVSTPVSLFRYVRRCWFERDRRGGLAGARDSVKWAMIRHIAIDTPRNRRRYAELFPTLDIAGIALRSPRAIARFYSEAGLGR